MILTELARPTEKSILVSYLVKYMNKVLKMANDIIEIVKISDKQYQFISSGQKK